MILRRMIENIRDQNWFTVTVEVLVVVIGIYLGLQAQQWGEERADRVEEQVYLARLESDVLTTIEHLKTSQSGAKLVLDSLEYILKIETQGETVLDYDALNKAIYFGMYNMQISSIQNSTYMEMSSSGKLSLLKDDELRTSLVEIESELIMKLRDDEKTLYDLVTAFIDPVLINYYPVDQIMRFGNNFAKYYRGKDLFKPKKQGDISEFLNDLKVRNAIIYRFGVQINHLIRLERLSEKYEKTLILIRAERAL